MTIVIDDIEYTTASDLLEELEISRQTLWRWRQQGRIPRGRLYRSKKLVFNADESSLIRDFANRLEPANLENPDQLRLFGRGGSGAQR